MKIAMMMVLAGAAVAHAGPLDPPAGPIGPTMKTLDEVEARTVLTVEAFPGDSDSVIRIDEPGSYYLSGPVLGEAGKHGIEIAASGVTLDLNGFELVGVAGSLNGIDAEDDQTGITVLNGVVRDWGEDGIELYTSNQVQGQTSRIRGVTALRNGVTGIRAGRGALIEDCAAIENGGFGISASYDSVVRGCTATFNEWSGFYLTQSVVEACAARVNQHGFYLMGRSEGSGLSATSNREYGVYVSRSSVRDSSAKSNGEHGVFMASDASVEGCRVANNIVHGIYSRGGSGYIAGNHIANNGANGNIGYGILHDLGNYTVIENNKLVRNYYGVAVTTTLNTVVGNTAIQNRTDNYSVVGGNQMGPEISSLSSTTGAHCNLVR